MTKIQQFAQRVLIQLKLDYPFIETPLIHRNAFELLIATMLSPQTNDLITNKVTPELFRRFPTPELLAVANVEEVTSIIRLVNYHKTKALRIIKASQQLLEQFNGQVPSTMSALLTLSGVGRKVANVVICEWFGKPAPSKEEQEYRERNGYPRIEKDESFITILPEGFVVDTHVLRISQRLHLSKHKTPEKVEKDLMEIFPREEWVGTSLRMIFHGREISQAKNPQYVNHPVWGEIYEEAGKMEVK